MPGTRSGHRSSWGPTPSSLSQRKLKAGLTTAEWIKIHACGDATRHFRTLRDKLGVYEFDTGFPIDWGELRRELGPEVTIWGGPSIMVLKDGRPEAGGGPGRGEPDPEFWHLRGGALCAPRGQQPGPWHTPGQSGGYVRNSQGLGTLAGSVKHSPGERDSTEVEGDGARFVSQGIVD
jgi:hypothetical protein